MTFIQLLDEALKHPTLATILNARNVKPDPSNFSDEPIRQSMPDALDDVDEFADKRGGCTGKMPKEGIILRDFEDNDVTDRLQQGFRDMMSIWVDHSPNWIAHKNFEEFPGQLSTRPPLMGPECVVWVDAPASHQPTGPTYGHGATGLPRTQTQAAWYHPEKGLWIDE